MAQINQYPIEIDGANPLGPEDFFDVDKFTGDIPPNGPFQSQKVTYGYLVTQLANDLVGLGNNLGNSDLTQTDPQRIFSGNGQNILWDRLKRFFIELSNDGADFEAGFKINQNGVTSLNKTLLRILKDNEKLLQIFESGRVEAVKNGLAVSDGTLPLTIIPGNESNPGVLSLFMSGKKPSVFTDIFFPEVPTFFEPQNSALAWFRSTSKGVLFPNMPEANRDAIITPELGLVIFNTTTNKLQVYSGVGLSGWQNMN